jgi:hypothetical protein
MSILAYSSIDCNNKIYIRKIKIDPELDFNYNLKYRFPDINHPFIDGEKEIIWLEDPRDYFFVRSRVFYSRRRSGKPKSFYTPEGGLLIGYSVLKRDQSSDHNGAFQRRFFYLNEIDLSPDCIYPDVDCHPSEGVDPTTIKPNFWGIHLQPYLHLYGGNQS